MGTHPIFGSDFDCLTDQIECQSLLRKKLCRLISSCAVRLDSCNKNWRSSDKNAENINLSERHSKTPTQTGNAGDSLVAFSPSERLVRFYQLLRSRLRTSQK